MRRRERVEKEFEGGGEIKRGRGRWGDKYRRGGREGGRKRLSKRGRSEKNRVRAKHQF